jgi:ABC-type multidrug transport system fused ATPase/permease subunit
MLAVLRKLGWFFRLEWKRYSVALVILALAGMVEVLPPRLIGLFIDGIQQGTLSGNGFMTMTIVWASVTVVGYLMNYIWHYKLFGGAFVLERTLRSRLMSHFLKMTPTFYERLEGGFHHCRLRDTDFVRLDHLYEHHTGDDGGGYQLEADAGGAFAAAVYCLGDEALRQADP